MVDKSVTRIDELLAVRPITEEIALKVLSTPGYEHLEITNGEWIGLDKVGDEMTTGEEHGWIETLILTVFANYALSHRAGRVYPGDVTFVLNGTSADIKVEREPDISFVLQANVTPTKGFIYRAPDLAVEIISPSQSYTEMTDKIDEYFQYGTWQVWLVIPDKKLIEVHYPDRKPEKYHVGQIITGGNLLSDFALDVSQVFES